MSNCSALERGVFLHDLGKIHIPDRILKKTELLQESEWKVMRGHSVHWLRQGNRPPRLGQDRGLVALTIAYPLIA